MKKLLILTAALTVLSPAAFARDSGEPKSCDGMSTPEIVDCVNFKTAQWDKRMNAAYQKALKEGEAQRQEQLRTAQRLWVQFRDANCTYFFMGEGTVARSTRPNACAT